MTEQRPKILLTYRTIGEKLKEAIGDKYDIEVETESIVTPRSRLLQKAKGMHVLVVMPLVPVDKEVLDSAGHQLKAVITTSAGFEHIDIEECKKRGIIVGYARTAIANGVANLAVALSLMVVRKLYQRVQFVKSGEWERNGTGNYNLISNDLEGSIIGIVGLGTVGFEVLKRMKTFGVQRILYFGTKRNPEGDNLGAEMVSFEDLLQSSDVVICCCALNDQTKHLFNTKAFSLMKPSSAFINISRGGIVDHDALHEALVSEKLSGAGLDVTEPEPLPSDHPLLKIDSCVIVPHIAGMTFPTHSAVIAMTAKNIVAALEGKELPLRLC